MISTARCNAGSTRGCRHPYPSVPVQCAGPLATDDVTHTAYVTAGLDSVSMIDTAACNADHLGGCWRRPPSFRAGVNGTGGVVDVATHTVYIADAGKGSTGTVTAVDERSCNATEHAGCATRRTLHVPGGNPTGIVLDQQTDTIYVATSVEHGRNLISVYNGATCNASDSAGCAQKPAVMTLAAAARHGQQVAIAIDQATNTVYATNNIYANPAGDDVYVFNTATCDAQDLSGCDRTPAGRCRRLSGRPRRRFAARNRLCIEQRRRVGRADHARAELGTRTRRDTRPLEAGALRLVLARSGISDAKCPCCPYEA